MFEGWGEFYLMIGSAAGALIGLLFVVETLSSGRDVERTAQVASVYISPLVYHFAMVLVMSGVALVPHIAGRAAGLAAGFVALTGLAATLRILWHLGPGKMVTAADPSDIWWYGVGPFISYVILAGAAADVLRHGTHGPVLLAAALMAILVLTIRNAWDLVSWLAPRAALESGK